MRLLCLVAIGAMLSPSPAEAVCMAPRIGDQFHAARAGDTVEGAAFVVTAALSSSTTPIEKVSTTSLDKVDLAPGLVAYRLAASARGGALRGGRAGTVKVTREPAALPALPAPKLERVSYVTRMQVRGSTEQGTALVDGSPPDGVLAIVVTDDKGTPLSWSRVGYQSEQTVYARGRCGVLPNGTVRPRDGQAVKVFWVDKYGRVSPLSNAVKASSITQTR